MQVTTASAAIALLQTGCVGVRARAHDRGAVVAAGTGVHVVDYVAGQQVSAGRDLLDA